MVRSHLYGRRRFLALLSAASAGTVLLGACQQPAAPQTVEVTRVVEKSVEKPVEVTRVVEKQVQVTQVVEKPVVVTATPPPQIKGAVNVWTFPLSQNDAEYVWKPLMGKFRERFPQIEAKVDVLPWEGRREKMVTAFAAGAPPDIAYVNTDTLSLFGGNDMLQDLGKIVPPEVWADHPEGVVKTGLSWKGKRIMIPNLLIIQGRVANQGLLGELGWDANQTTYTWADALKLGGQAKEKGQFATNYNLVQVQDWIDLVWQAGGTLFNEDATKSLLDQPPAEEALTFLTDLFQKGYVPKEGAVGSWEESAAATTVDYFITGKQVISKQRDPDVIRQIKQDAAKMKYAVVLPFKNKDQATVTGAGAWGIFTKTKNGEAAARWVNFMVEPENQGFYCSATNLVPPRVSATTFWIVDPDVRKFVDAQRPFGRVNQDTNYFFTEGVTTYLPKWQQAILGKAPVKQALADGHREMQKAMDAFWVKQKP